MCVKIANEPPTDEVLRMRKQGLDDDMITDNLSRMGYDPKQISEAISQADIKGGVEGSIPSPMESTGMQPSALTPGAEGETEEIPIPIPTPGAAAEPPMQTVRMPQVGLPSMGPMPSMQSQGIDTETVQELVESIIDERWQEVVASVGDISIWRSKVEDDIASIKQEILRVEDRFSKLQASIIGKVDEYSRSISQVSTEMEALEKVFGKIMEPLTSNIKELNRITKELKKK